MTPGKMMLIFGAFYAIITAALPNIVWLMGWLLSRLTGHHFRYAPFGWTALGLALAASIIVPSKKEHHMETAPTWQVAV